MFWARAPITLAGVAGDQPRRRARSSTSRSNSSHSSPIPRSASSCLVHLKPDATIAIPVAIGLAAAALLAAGFLVVQRRGFDLVRPICPGARPRLGRKTAAGAAALHAALAAIYRRRGAGLRELCAPSRLLDRRARSKPGSCCASPAPRSAFATVLVIESLLYAARSVAFAVPNAVGVQEGAYILLGASFGLTPETALALSLLKRARDLTIGLPALVAWQLLESGRLWRRIASRGRIRPAENRNPGRDDRGFSLVSWLR